jgi:transcriptional regulator
MMFMYLPKIHEETRIDVLHQLIRSYSLGTLVVMGDGELVANHIPFFLDTSRGEFGTLVAHVSRANNLWQLPVSNIPALICFQGAQSYITPSWYPSKQETGKAVPTWNYAVVHAQGIPRFIQDSTWLLEHIELLTREHESAQTMPWQVKDAPAEYIEKLVTAIVGIEIPLHSLIGKWKTSQNRPEVDKHEIVAGLSARAGEQDLVMAELIQQHMSAD